MYNHKIKLLTSTFICALITGTANAETDTWSSGWNASIEAGLFATDRGSTDTSILGNTFVGRYIAGSIGRSFGSWEFSLDGRGEFLNDKNMDDVYETGPVETAVLGFHGGRSFKTRAGDTYVGAYLTRGYFDGYDRDDGMMNGRAYGLEAEHNFTNNLSVFGQFGYAIAVGDPDDNEFRGYTQRIGVWNTFSEKMGAGISLERGYSPDCFEDCYGDWGRYFGINLEVDYNLTNNIALVGRLSHLKITANTEDMGLDTSLYVGARYTFGGNKLHNNLATSLTAFKAAGWMHPLD